ncbi:MAG: exonuclease domain-containing protein [Clostridia bacterium]|nr:exonuclease domain-containing protein [Clostridia bacterium]
MNYIVLDLEWNQPTSRNKLITDPIKLYGEIIQIGAVSFDSDFNRLGDISITVAPKYYTEMNHYVRALTGIRTRDLKKGKPFPEALREFKEWCGADCCFITWGPDDMSVLNANMKLHSIDSSDLPRCYNLQLIFNKQITGENRQWSLASAMEKLDMPLDLACHDALNDAIYTARICSALDMDKGIAEYVEPPTKEKKAPGSRYHRLKPHLITAKEISSERKDSMRCPHCDLPLVTSRRLRMRNRDKVFLASCPDHGSFLIILMRKRNAESNHVYEENIYTINEQTEGFFNKMSLKCSGRCSAKAPRANSKL